MFISCIGATRLEYSAVSRSRRAAFDHHATALARQPGVPRGALAGRGDAPDPTPDGRLVEERAHAELPRRGRTGPGSRRRDERPADRARRGRAVPARGRGVPRPHESVPLGRGYTAPPRGRLAQLVRAPL